MPFKNSSGALDGAQRKPRRKTPPSRGAARFRRSPRPCCACAVTKHPKACCAFFRPTESVLHDPFLMPDIEAAIARLHRAILSREPMMVHGDYDVDGITSTAMLMRALLSAGRRRDAAYSSPQRRRLRPQRCDGGRRGGARLRADSDRRLRRARRGSGGVRERTRRRSHHHRPPRTVARRRFARRHRRRHPKRADSNYPFDELSGCGVAFKVMQALLLRHWPKYAPSFWDKFVELAGMAAIADCVRWSMKTVFWRARACARSRVLAKPDVRPEKKRRPARRSFHLARQRCRLSSGAALERRRTARFGVVVLATFDFQRCGGMRGKSRCNWKASTPSGATSKSASSMKRARWFPATSIYRATWRCHFRQRLEAAACWALSREDWPSVLPSAIVLNAHEGVASGSGRVPPFRFAQRGRSDARPDFARRRPRSGLRNGAGNGALGRVSRASTRVRRRRAFARRSGAACRSRLRRHRTRFNNATGARPEKLEPCGNGNPEARLLLRGAKILDGKCIGARGEHLKWQIEADGARFDALWCVPVSAPRVSSRARPSKCVFVPELNHWNGNTRLQLIVKDARALR